jgi:hypothetical protein
VGPELEIGAVMTLRLDRRRFLTGAGGAFLALPMLEAFAPRRALGQTAAPPKRVIFIHHPDGRLVGDGSTQNGILQDLWSPGPTTRALPIGAPPSPMLAELAAIRDEIVTIDGVDNLVRHTTGDIDGHYPADVTCLTCQPPKADGSGSDASIDYVAGDRLRSGPAMPATIVFPAGFEMADWRDGNSLGQNWGPGGTAPRMVSLNPQAAIGQLFGPPAPVMPPPAPTLQDRLVARRKSILDGVLGNFSSLRAKLNAADQQRLDQHAAFIRSVEMGLPGPMSGPMQRAAGCLRPDESSIMLPISQDDGGTSGKYDPAMVPFQIENLVQSLACDVTRSATLLFWNGDDPVFPAEFPGYDPNTFDNTSPFATMNWHGTIHESNAVDAPHADDLRRTYQWFGRMFTLLVQRLAAIQDLDGSRLLDNTLVVWVAELGYGTHTTFNIPVVLAGMRSAFANGQGRHLVVDRRSLGDLYAQVLRILGGSDTTFGATGTVGSVAAGRDIMPDFGFPGFVTSATPLHLGPLDL